MKRVQTKFSQRWTSNSQHRTDWKDSRLVVATLSVAGTATVFSTVIMPLANSMLTNKIEKLTEISASAVAVAEELEKVKKQLAVAKAEAKIANLKSPFVPGSAYPIGFDAVVLGLGADEVFQRIPLAKWDEERSYIVLSGADGAVFHGAAFFLDSKRKVSSILYHFSDDAGPEIVRRILLANFGPPFATRKNSALWKIGAGQWASLSQKASGMGSTFVVAASPSPSFWGDFLPKNK